MLKFRRIIIFFVFVGLFSLSYQIGSMSQVPEEEAQIFLEEFQSLIEDIDAVGLFLHNTALALPMFIPGFGVAWGFFSAYQTGYAFASMATVIPALAEIPALSLIYASPFGLMELAAYSLGTSRSFILIHMIIKKTSIRPTLPKTAIEIGIVVGLLLAGGILENYMINMIPDAGL